jgi:hypothetical protein
VQRSPTDSREDLLEGIDLFFEMNGNKYTCQVKPLKSFTLVGDKYIVKSTGKIKHYHTHYMCFIDRINKKYILFQNKNVLIDQDTLTFDAKCYVSSN